MESEETQDYVSEAKSTEQEEMEERIFVPSAVRSVPQKPLFRCDNQCREKTLSFWQLASVVGNEGDEAYTTNLCQKSFNKHLQAGVKCAVDTGGGKEGVPWKAVENDGQRTIHTRNVGIFCQGRSREKRFRELAEQEQQAGIQGKWQQESSARKYLEQVKCCHDTECNEPMMKKGFTALKKW